MKFFHLIIGLLLISTFVVYLAAFDPSGIILNTILSILGVFAFLYAIFEIIKRYK